MSSQNLGRQSSKATDKELNSPIGSINNDERSASGNMQDKQLASEATPGDAVESEKTAKPPGPPNGGTRAWMQVIGAFVLFFNTWYSVV